ncbi:MAG: hypothetical protein U9P14_09090 [Gemmatimonadota bacterium]|nr:hypothetical protein [Gemmatimonadota bacterium]
MRAKHIIVGVLALVGLGFGAYNWINYFKQSAPSRPAVQAVRPAPEQQPSSEAGQASKPRPAAQAASGGPESIPAPGKPQDEKLTLEKKTWATIGRNPFFTLEEIEMIASGKYLAQAPVAQNQMVMLPELELTGLIIDRKTGRYRALIGGKVYNKDDRVGMERVVEITGSEVTLEYAGRLRTLVLAARKAEGKSSSRVSLKKAP